MATLLNIGGDANDEDYRYKMPKMLIKVEGSGNGIKTLVINMSDVARSLHIPPQYVTRFFGTELNAQSKYDEKREAAQVNGEFDYKSMFAVLQEFIQEFILCPNCHLPELVHSVDKKQILVDCAACGHNGELQTVHKLTKYILSHPPDESGMQLATNEQGGGKLSKKELKRLKKMGKLKDEDYDAQTTSTGTSGDSDDEEQGGMVWDGDLEALEGMEDKPDEEVVWLTDTSEEAAAKRAADAGGDGDLEALEGMEDKPDEEVVWLTDTSEEAAAKRAADAGAAMALLERETLPKTPWEVDVDEELGKVIANLTKMVEDEASGDDIYKAAMQSLTQEDLDGPEERAYVIMASMLTTTNPQDLMDRLETYEDLLGRVAMSEEEQRVLIGAVERFATYRADRNFKLVPIVLKTLFDFDNLDEEMIISWSERNATRNRYIADRADVEGIKEAMEPMITWLMEADSEDDEEEEESEDESD
eukprot:TRINITY_DN1591_c0_g1_i2.p1 TRINITY_DN1591_c0_g1~~TRINITY_DN1591_c0_g1_i2.p1  ORF type:complete len:484 (-),score=196.78 TRINITY_DN1591_c0_g1_i2:79-1503(-)